MNIYYCVDDIGLNSEIGQLLLLSVRSAVRHSGSAVYCLYCGDGHSLLDLIRKAGATIISHVSAIDEEIKSAHKEVGFPLHARGAYLRYEIPKIDVNELSMYVDCDVVFTSRFSSRIDTPGLVAAVPELRGQGFNSGVLIFRNQAFRERVAGFLDFAKKNFGRWKVGVDQLAFNHYFSGEIESLRSSLNWRPAWGKNSDCEIVHFHGSKLTEVSAFVSGNISREYVDDYIHERANIMSGDVESSVWHYSLLEEFIEVGDPPFIKGQLSKLRAEVNLGTLGRKIVRENAHRAFLQRKLLEILTSPVHSPRSTKSYSFTVPSGSARIKVHPSNYAFFGSLTLRFEPLPGSLAVLETGNHFHWECAGPGVLNVVMGSLNFDPHFIVSFVDGLSQDTCVSIDVDGIVASGPTIYLPDSEQRFVESPEKMIRL